MLNCVVTVDEVCETEELLEDLVEETLELELDFVDDVCPVDINSKGSTKSFRHTQGEYRLLDQSLDL